MPTFKPPSRFTVPRILPNTPMKDQKPIAYMKADIPIGANVWIYTDNTISEQQPPLWEPRLNQDGSITPGVKKVFYGGHVHTISTTEALDLTAAGYGAYITYTAIFDTSTYDTDTLA